MRPICILGMHRSGTSLTAQITRSLGIDFGPAEDLLGAHEQDNPRGYAEQPAIVALNDDIMDAYRGSWWRAPPFMPPRWQRSARVEPLRRRAAETVATLYGPARWGFKDPRTSLTLPLWRSVVGDMDCVICVREPAEVAASLTRRAREMFPDSPIEQFDQRDWVALWTRYTRAALKNSRGLRRLIVCHEDLMTDGNRQVERIAAFLGDSVSDEARERAAALIEPQLWHNRAGRIAEVSARDVPRQAQRRYRRLADEARQAG